jgi:hypothetical protein
MPNAKKRNIENLRNWIERTSCIVPTGAAYLYQAFRILTFRRRRDFTEDEHVFIFGSAMTSISRAVMSVLATSILITPVAILEFVSGNVARLVTIVLAAGAFVLAISLLAKTRTVEVLAAKAA